jgi:hypothetical protein
MAATKDVVDLDIKSVTLEKMREFPETFTA